MPARGAARMAPPRSVTSTVARSPASTARSPRCATAPAEASVATPRTETRSAPSRAWPARPEHAATTPAPTRRRPATRLRSRVAPRRGPTSSRATRGSRRRSTAPPSACCARSGADGAGCAPASAACSTSADRCENGVAVRCLHGHEVRVDCGAAGLACDGAGAPVGACRVPSVAGGPVDPCLHAPAPSCGTGGSLTYCATAAGGMRRLSCKQGGLERCVRDSHGARCAP